MKDPIGFVKKLQEKKDLGLPERQKIAEIPVIDFSRYYDASDSAARGHRHATRHRRENQSVTSLVKTNNDSGALRTVLSASKY